MVSQKVAVTNIEGVAIVSTVILPEFYDTTPYETIVFSDLPVLGDFLTRNRTKEDAMLTHIDAIALVLKVKEQNNE
jgi:hypothetical protein